MLLTYAEAPTWADWRWFIQARWRLMKRWFPALRYEGAAKRAQRKAHDAWRRQKRQDRAIFDEIYMQHGDVGQHTPPPYSSATLQGLANRNAAYNPYASQLAVLQNAQHHSALNSQLAGRHPVLSDLLNAVPGSVIRYR